MLKLRCKDIGFKCGFVAIGNTKESIMWAVVEHLIGDHGIKLENMTPQIIERARTVIRVRGG